MDNSIDKIDRIIAAQFMDSFYPCFDGVTVCMDNYARFLNQKDGAFVVAPRFKGYDDGQLPYDVIRLTGIKIPGLQYKYILRWLSGKPIRQIKRRDIDICHTHSPFVAGKVARSVARKKGIPLIATFHTQFKSDFYKYTHSKLLTNFAVSRVVSFYNKCTEVWAVNSATADVLRSYGYKGPLEIMPNGTDLVYPANGEQLAEGIKTKYKIADDVPVFMFVGRLTLQKNIEMILRALRLYLDRGNEFVFFCVGYGDDENKIKSISHELGLDKQVVFTGKISDRALLSEYYLASDMFLFPSLYDTDGLVKREAAACHTPSIVVSGSNAASDVKHGVNGYVIENTPESLADQLVAAMSDRAANRQVGIAASQTIARQWSSIVDDVYLRYGDVIRTFNRIRENKRT